MSAWQIFLKGGPVMGLIILSSIVSLSIIFNRLRYFSSISVDENSFKSKVFDLIKQNKIKDAIVLCEQASVPIARIFKAGMFCFGAQRAEIIESMKLAGQLEIALMERHLMGLSMIVQLAPILGLLGTMMGLANSFFVIQSRSLALNPIVPGDIAGGIWQALLTTIFGLIVSVVTMLFYHYFIYRIDEFIAQTQRLSMELLGIMTYSSLDSGLVEG